MGIIRRLREAKATTLRRRRRGLRREATTLRRRRGRGGLRKVPLARLWAIEGEDVVCEVQGWDGFERLRV